MKKYLSWLVGALVILYLVRHPVRSADFCHHVGTELSAAADSLSRFVDALDTAPH